MEDFYFNVATKIHFGKGKVKVLPSEIEGNHIFFMYGARSAKMNGVYDDVMEQCRANNIEVTEFTGVEPNPRHTTVTRGVDLLRQSGADTIVAAGGGSIIDCAKAIAMGFYLAGDAWELYEGKDEAERAVPIISIPTVAASGSEVSNVSVISNMDLKKKLHYRHDVQRPKAAIIDPAYTFSLPKFQTSCGIVDIMCHSFEGYFSHSVGSLQDGLAESVNRTCVQHGRKVMTCPDDYDSRAQLMASSALSITHLSDCGRSFVGNIHSLEHVLSAHYDIAHGAGIAIVSLAWFKFALSDKTANRFARWGREVWDIRSVRDDYTVAVMAIEAYESFIRELELPARISELKGEIPREALAGMAHEFYPVSNSAMWFKPVRSESELLSLLELAY